MMPEHLRQDPFCPRCGAPVAAAKSYFIDWKEDRKQFTVLLAFYCTPCMHRYEEENVKNLPLIILEKSACEPG